jgi:hypothetical protein
MKVSGPDFEGDPVHQAMLAEEEAAKAAGMPWIDKSLPKDLSRLTFARGRYRMQKNRAWRKANPVEAGEGVQLEKALDGDDLEGLVAKAAVWMRGRGFELLTKVAEGEPCACCAKCKVQRPDLKAVAILSDVVSKAIALELARIQHKRASREKTDVELDWPAEGAKG